MNKVNLKDTLTGETWILNLFMQPSSGHTVFNTDAFIHCATLVFQLASRRCSIFHNTAPTPEVSAGESLTSSQLPYDQ